MSDLIKKTVKISDRMQIIYAQSYNIILGTKVDTLTLSVTRPDGAIVNYPMMTSMRTRMTDVTSDVMDMTNEPTEDQMREWAQDFVSKHNLS